MRSGSRSVPSRRFRRPVRTRTGRRSGRSPRASATPASRRAPDPASSSANRRCGQVDDLGVGALLEPGRRLGPQAEPPRGPGDGDGQEPRHLEQDVGGGAGDLGVGATHHAGDADRPVLAVADQQVVGGERALDVVEGHEVSPSCARRTRKPPPAHLGQVVGVVGLAQLEHHVVGHVDHVLIGRMPRRVSRRAMHRVGVADRHAAEDPGHEPPAQVGVDDLDPRPARCRSAGTSSTTGSGSENGTPSRAARSRATPGDRHGVGSVGVDLEVVEHVGLDAERLGDRRADRQVPAGEDEDAGVVVAQAELARRAEHPVGPLAPQLPAADLHAVRASPCRRSPAARGRRPPC